MTQCLRRSWLLLLLPLSLALVPSAASQESTEQRKPAPANHWSFQPIARPAPPAVKDSGWIRNPIDRFILANLENQGIAPSPEADRVTLVRRLYLDLLGLPPTPTEV